MPKKDPQTLRDIMFADSPALDSFSRLRISEIETLFDSSFEYNVHPTLWKQITAGAGAISHLQQENSIKLQVGTLSGDKATHQTKGYHRYQPGKSQLLIATGLLGAPKHGVESRVGYFDDDNGVFFEQSESCMNVVVRSNVSGSVVNTKVGQASWNLDRLDSKGPSRTLLDCSKIQIFVIDLQWLGAGRVRFGFHIAGEIIYVHEFIHANRSIVPFMRTCNLPVRYEIENVAAAPSATEMKQTCSMVASEGGFNAEGFLFSAHTVLLPATINSRVSVLSIRPKALFGGITNRVLISPQKWSAFTDTNDAIIEIVKGGTLGGTPSWVDPGPDSAVEYTRSQVTVTGGIVVDADFVQSGGPVTPGFPATGDTSLLSRFVHGLDNATQEVFSIVADPGGSNAIVRAALRWKEYY